MIGVTSALAIYGAALSTVAVVWNLYRDVHARFAGTKKEAHGPTVPAGPSPTYGGGWGNQHGNVVRGKRIRYYEKAQKFTECHFGEATDAATISNKIAGTNAYPDNPSAV